MGPRDLHTKGIASLSQIRPRWAMRASLKIGSALRGPSYFHAGYTLLIIGPVEVY